MTAGHFGRLLGIAVLLSAAGCGGGSSGTLMSGKVTLAGAPVTGGTVIFEPLGGGGQAASGTIQADGTYSVPNVPAGDCKVTVDTEYLRTTAGNTPKLPGGIDAPPSAASLNGLKYVKIDAKYSKVATTDIKVTVAGSKQTFDIALK